MPYLTMRKKTKATIKPWFSRLVQHPARKRSGSILGHNTHILHYQPNTDSEFCRTAVDTGYRLVRSPTGKCIRSSAVSALYCRCSVIAQRHSFLAHSYADDTQLYFHDKVPLSDIRLLRLKVKECISDIERWMS